MKKNLISNEKKLSNTDKTDKSERRKFLKKTFYSAPVIITMGQLVKPKTANADFSGGQCGDPGQPAC